jgi:hypothetical protein
VGFQSLVGREALDALVEDLHLVDLVHGRRGLGRLGGRDDTDGAGTVRGALAASLLADGAGTHVLLGGTCTHRQPCKESA